MRFETPEGGPKKKNFAVLKHTKMPSAISEASDITQEHYPITESYLFDDPPNYSHIQHEGAALFHGWQSYRDNAGFVYIDYVSLFGNNPDDKRVLVDDELVEVPWRTSWNAGSYHWIEANWQTTWSGTTCYFHHWEEKETGITNVARLSNWLIPEESTHTYIAYYTGGPYFVDLFAPIGGEYWTAGDTAWILLDFGSSNGIENSALIDIWLDRSGGSGGYPNRIVQNYPLSQGISIPIAPALPGSNNCKIKVWSRDLAENQAYTYSEQSFYLYLIGDVNQSDNITLGDVIYLVNYVFDKPQGSCQTSDPDPCWPITPLYRGDANGDCNVTLADITYLANYYFGVGPQPVRCPSLPSAKTLAVSK